MKRGGIAISSAEVSRGARGRRAPGKYSLTSPREYEWRRKKKLITSHRQIFAARHFKWSFVRPVIRLLWPERAPERGLRRAVGSV
ncbi:hypothetical protein EVAR_5894_1 [Eumeta japonica]|uniref:Uncharacterized protein n=1 Tax=Eumeta variegata TaxID=151549 RepID=A0A4C1TC66_EUMVA|nr:hypothetical protein EVAR_5894_1 [Eumeta japonica]